MNIKTIFLLLLSTISGYALSSCQSAAKAVVDHSDSAISVKSTGVESLDQFLTSFENAVLAHRSNDVINCLDKDYKKEQYEKQMKFNTDSFLNAFFSNFQMEKNSYKIVFKNISKLTRTDSKVLAGTYSVYSVTYTVWAGSVSQSVVISVFSQLDKGVLKHSIYGPVSS